MNYYLKNKLIIKLFVVIILLSLTLSLSGYIFAIYGSSIVLIGLNCISLLLEMFLLYSIMKLVFIKNTIIIRKNRDEIYNRHHTEKNHAA